MPAEPDHGRLAGAAFARNLGERGPRCLLRMFDNPARHPLFGATEFRCLFLDLSQHVVKLHIHDDIFNNSCTQTGFL